MRASYRKASGASSARRRSRRTGCSGGGGGRPYAALSMDKGRNKRGDQFWRADEKLVRSLRAR